MRTLEHRRKILNPCFAVCGARRIVWAVVFMVALLTVYFVVAPMTSAHAQVTKSSRLELTDDHAKFYIGPESYLTSDQAVQLNENIIGARHESNLKGTRQNGSVVNLGLDGGVSWLVFSVLNTSSTSDWILNFGGVLEGRYALAQNVSVYDYTNETYLIRAVREKQTSDAIKGGIPGGGFNGAAARITVPRNQASLFILKVQTEDGMPGTITPYMQPEARYIRGLTYSSGVKIVHTALNVILIAFTAFFLFIAIVRRNQKYVVFCGFYALHIAILYLIEHTFFAAFALSGEILVVLCALTGLYSLILSKIFFDWRGEHFMENTVFVVAGGLVILATLFNVMFLNNASIWDDVLLFACLALPAVLNAVMVLPALRHKQSHILYYGLAWFILLVGLIVLSLAAAGVIAANWITLNAYWAALVMQGAFLLAAMYKKIQVIERDKLTQKSRDNRAARSMERLKIAKESTDQARLLRVIERERELMAELREREVQRTNEMRRAKDTADQANRAKSAFLAVVSHEIRTPMTGILGMVRLLQDTKLSRDQHEYAIAIQKSGDTMMALLNDILDFEKIESGNMELEAIDFDLPKLIQGIVTLMSGHAANKDIALKSDIAPDVPSVVVGDPTRLRQVLLNLVSNAIKFTENGSVTIRLRLAQTDNGDDNNDHAQNMIGDDQSIIEFAVIDTGIGISSEAQKALFDPFAQANTSITRKYGGTGLGLAICRRLVTAMGGQIQVKSMQGEGSTFYYNVLFDHGSDFGLRETESDLSSRPALPPMLILVVEDNEMNRRVLKAFLEKSGHNAILAQSGEAAMDILNKEHHSFDAIFMDINLFGMSGIDTTAHIRALDNAAYANLPIIAITGNVRDEEIKSYYAAGMNGFIPKPIEPESIYNALEGVHTGNLESPTLSATTSAETMVSLDDNEPEILRAMQAQNSPNLGENTDQDQDQAVDQGNDNDVFAVDIGESDDLVPDDFLNIETLSSFIDNLGKDQYQGLMDGFLDMTTQLIQSLENLQDADSINARAHELKGMAGNFGFAKLGVIAGEIEHSAKADDLPTAINQISILAGVYADSKTALKMFESDAGL